jgi:sialate O-acetylesterase
MEDGPMIGKAACAIAVLFATLGVSCGLEFGLPFGSHMVLPAGRDLAVWGTGATGGQVALRFGEHAATGHVQADGTWKAVLRGMPPSATARVLQVEAAGGAVKKLEDVLVGEVWFCAGQSNMDFPLGRAVGGGDEAARAENFPSIRLLNLTAVDTANRPFDAAELGRLTPERLFEGRWTRAGGQSAAAFSAVGWWAGREIHGKRKVPVGLVDVSVGGSGAEAWLPREVLQARADYAELLGTSWLESTRVSAWARGRAKVNLGGKPGAHPYQPGFLFDAGVREWRGFPLSGVLWYQGETNAEIRDDVWNGRLITDLVIGWRRILEQPGLPFYMVQLPRIGGNDPLRKGWPQFREVQARAAAKLDGVNLIVTHDLGWDSPDVHPPDKRPVGQRLGEAAARQDGSF